MGGQTGQTSSQKATSSVFFKFVSSYSRIVDSLVRVGTAIGSVFLAFIMFMTLLDVLGRGLGGVDAIHDAVSFLGPIPGSLEMTELGLGVLIIFGLSYCALFKGHIRVDLILAYTSRKTNLWFDIFTYGICFLFFSAVTWQAWINGINLYHNRLTTAVLLIPIFPFPFVLVAGAALLSLVLLRDFLKSVQELIA
jgi:TRAP-type C4-dicarboxylate transport system permease small subunit